MRIGRTYVYERPSGNGDKSLTFTILAVIAGLGAVFTGYKSYSSFSTYNDVGSSFRKLIFHHTDNDNQFNPQHNGDVVHVNIPQQELIFERSAFDPYLNVEVPGAVTLGRNVEYCQWMEHVHERTEKTSNGNERVTRTYTYTKGWRSYPINSLFFDQPAAHHNPQRRPVNSGIVDRIGVSSEKGFKVSASLMENLRTPSSIISFRPESLKNFISSPAYANEKFFYTGNNGWFLSKYQPSTAETAMKMAFQYIEGTLFDFQLGDLFSVCDAGDVRVQLQGKVINEGLSLIALQKSDGSLVPFKTLSGRDLILLQHGQLSAQTMMDNELHDLFVTFILFIVGFVVCGGLCGLFSYLLKKENDKKNTENITQENSRYDAKTKEAEKED